MISGRTQLYGVLGHPVGHSLSPAMHNAAFEALGLDAAYVALPVAPERLPEALAGAHALGFRGLNVTVPHKQRAAELCGALDEVSRLCGAVNTLRRAAEGWEGFNTDAPACRDLAQAAGAGPGQRAVVLGAGGAALAGAWALLALGLEVKLAARRPAAAAGAAARLRAAFPAGPAVGAVPWEAAGGEAARAEVLLQATSVGLAGAAPGALPASPRPGQLAIEFVYGDTAFARAARAAGTALVTGEALLLRQGALAFTLFTGRAAPEPVMARALGAAPRAP
ncbi:shikimate dehydrogenase (NADP+) [Anaeromyxobacter diazotrophicus]|uniref:Shikimate dehydrogenase (NADP(+)) n=1 Tax=Anaeromyxobacter diazotrophicus TaxID=2590199 RepID=A0A7I9VRL4_9BACT|nr:shikimate dehydrogenase (NADP+) [Anaeromyxobacter diazotrophicus]GEJ58577.1 shikimate dehydrogenase (NADP(+)) [Anaeromyxobacter diazotrophicus]